MSNVPDWPFDHPPNTACITTRLVLEEGYPILLVTHDADDGSWQFLCGSTNNTADGRVVGLSQMLRLEPQLSKIADLPLGWKAWRESTNHSWVRCPKDRI